MVATTGLLAQQAKSVTPSASAVPNYPRYRLVEFPPLGGATSGSFGASKQLNSRGEAIAQSDTAIPIPDCPGCLVGHGVVLERNGLMTDLGALPGINASVPVGISESGLIAGFSTYGLLVPWQAVLWNRDRSIVALGTFGGTCSTAYSVNNRGQVVGMALNAVPENPDFAAAIARDCPAATQARAVRWQDGSMLDLGTLGGNDAAAIEVNEGGQIVGISYTDTLPNDTTGIPTIHPFLWQNGTMTDLGSLGGTQAFPGTFGGGGTRAVNDSGEVAGTSMLPGDQVWHAFFWSHGTMIDLGTFGGSKSEAFALSKKGQVLGRAVVTDTPFVRHAFLWEKGHMTDLHTVAGCTRSTAQSINPANQIVGSLGGCADNPDDPTFFSAFYVEKGKPMADLNTLIDPPSPIHIDEAWNINERGEIFGSGFLPDGSTRAFLLVPLPGSH